MSTSPATETATNAPEFSVSEITTEIKRTLEGRFDHVRIRGEVTEFMAARSGHLYMSLKDENAKLRAVCWKGVAARMKFRPEDGLEVIATGKLTNYGPRSEYQLVIDSLEPAGAGALMALLEERRKKLTAEGLFDEARKQPIPFLPKVIGVVTSPTGAVIRDILHRLADRFPRHVLLWPVQVQGDAAAGQVAAAIEGFNALEANGPVPRPDVLIVGRGGGSLEDLWAFNEEIVVRAAAASRIPLISAVGHETDTTLIDYAADRRAPTPTAAAEMAVPVRDDLLYQLSSLEHRKGQALRRAMEEKATGLRALDRAMPSLTDLIGLRQQRFDDAAGRLPRALQSNTQSHQQALADASAGLRPALFQSRLMDAARRLDDCFARLRPALDRHLAQAQRSVEASARLLETLSYQGVLARGFAVVRGEGDAVLTSAKGVKSGTPLSLEFKDGRAQAVAAGGKRPKSSPKSKDDQGTLL
ncbi:MAG: exodeoxyribonuclease VII large subunit [Alphaproteobacteria bacterium]